MAAVPVAVNVAVPLTPFQECLLICGLTGAQRVAIEREGLHTLDDLAMLRIKDIHEMVKRIVALSPARGGVHIGQLHIRKIEALWYWVFDQKRRSIVLDHITFTPDTITTCIEQLNLDEQQTDDRLRQRRQHFGITPSPPKR